VEKGLECQRPFRIRFLYSERAGRQYRGTVYERYVVQVSQWVDYLVGFGGICACCTGDYDIANGGGSHLLGASTVTIQRIRNPQYTVLSLSPFRFDQREAL